MIDERLLHGMQWRTRRAQSLDSDLVPGAHDCKRQAREGAAAVQMHGACSALTMAAAFRFSHEAGVIANRVQQRRA